MAPSLRERQFLDPAVVARLGTLELKARTIVEGFLSGLHRSPFKGFSVEFAEYRQYMPGDDISTIDWKVFARSDRYYIKKFEEETNLDCHLMLDISGSMGYGSRGITKMQYGQCLAASLAYLMNPANHRINNITRIVCDQRGIYNSKEITAKVWIIRYCRICRRRSIYTEFY